MQRDLGSLSVILLQMTQLQLTPLCMGLESLGAPRSGLGHRVPVCFVEQVKSLKADPVTELRVVDTDFCAGLHHRLRDFCLFFPFEQTLKF